MYVAAHKPGSDLICLDILIQSPPTYEVEREGTIHVRLDALRRFAEQLAKVLHMKP